MLYAGLILTPDGPRVLEYNVRFGDPETQVVLPLLTEDLTALLSEAASGRLRTEPRFSADAAVCVVMAAEHYPGAPRTGDAIDGLEAAATVDGVTVFHAGTGLDDEGRFVTAGGRVLGVTGVGPDVGSARRRAYEAVDRIGFPGMQYRRDIAGGAAMSSLSDAGAGVPPAAAAPSGGGRR